MKKGLTKFICAALTAAMAFSCVPFTECGIVAPQVVQAATEIGITESQGWLESAWVEWKPSTTANVSYYTVSYSKDGASYTRIDDELIRMYKDGHWRADVVGISHGSYTLKVEAFSSSNTVVASETADVTVSAHDRTGFTFSPKSTCYDSSDPLQCGGYKGDGTPKDGAEIIYITSASDIDSVTVDGVTGLSKILQGRDKITTKPLIVRIVGKIEYSGSQLNGSGYVQIKPSKAYTNYKVTIEGIGEDATINFGFLIRNGGNVEIRNLAVHDFKDDGMSLDTDNCNVWLHNNEYFYGVQKSGDKAKGDGSADVKNDSQYVTFSYNHFWDSGKCSLCGMTSESGDNYITYHHNWFDHSDSRHPRIRTMFVHIFNNYYDGNAKYGVGASKNSNAFVEGNYFRNCKHPTLQGSVGYDSDGSGGSNTFEDSPSIGAIKLWNNVIEGANVQFKAGQDGETAADNDGCVATARNQSVNYTTAAGAVYRNTDVSDSYIQSLASVVQEPADAKTTVQKYAGRVGGGDFAQASGFAFTSADDTDYEINTTLRNALTSYCADDISSNHIIASIGGSVDGSVVPVKPTESTESTTSDTSESTQATTRSDETTESTTAAPISNLAPIEEGIVYDAASMYEDSASFEISGNKGKDGQIKIDEKGYVSFAVNSGANVVINYKCGSTNTSKSSSISCAGKTGATLKGKADPTTLELENLSAGEYKITAQQSGGTTAQIISIAVTYSGGGENTVIWGDADESGYLTSNDCAIILAYTLYKSNVNISDNAIARIDVDGNQSIDAADAATVLIKVLDSSYVFDAEK